MNDAEKERIHLLNTHKLVQKFIEVLSSTAIRIRAMPESPDPRDVSRQLDADIKKLFDAYPGGVDKFTRHFITYIHVVQQLRMVLLTIKLETLLNDAGVPEDAPSRADTSDIGAALDNLLGFKR